MRRIVVIALACCALAACEDKKAPTETPAATTSAPAPEPAEEPAPTLSDDDIPTREDFEEEALQEITVENMEEELDKLEAEIGG